MVRMGPAASGRGLCDIDRVFFRVAKSRVQNWEVHARENWSVYTRRAMTSEFFDT